MIRLFCVINDPARVKKLFGAGNYMAYPADFNFETAYYLE